MGLTTSKGFLVFGFFLFLLLGFLLCFVCFLVWGFFTAGSHIPQTLTFLIVCRSLASHSREVTKQSARPGLIRGFSYAADL